ncbi:MAG TPA: DUF2889 domain-containing protein [Castellaniella sp.]|uniref:DUF2889 domain-containing protein n=1 Tax=Castellaniella sp. TaxID=1955812 RepID=UPI002EED3D6E
MPLSAPACSRQPLHTRTIRVHSYVREDGLFDIEAELVDVKAYDFVFQGGELHQAGEPVHDMHLRVTIDDKFTIRDAEVVYDAAPYGEFCSAIAPDYKALVGLNLLRQFRHEVRERFGRTAGCTHVTELTNVLPTVAVQTMAGRRHEEPGKRPFQLDGCHALRVDGPVVQKYYPSWHVPPGTDHEGG